MAEAAAAIAPNPPVTPAAVPPKGADSKFKSVRESLGLKSKAPPAPPAATPPVPATPPKPKKTVAVVAAQPAAPLDVKELGKEIGRAVVEATRPPAPPAPKDVVETLSPAAKRKYATLERMAKNNAALAEKPKEFLESHRKLAAYQTEWEAANTGKKFNIEDEEHSDFLTANDVTWDEDEFQAAREDLIREDVTEAAKKDLGGKFSEVEQRERAREAAPKMIAHQVTAAKVLFNELGEDFAKVLGADGQINTDEIKLLVEKDPAYEDVLPLANKVEEVTGELFRAGNGLTSLAGNNPVHAEIISFAIDAENRLKAKPANEQLNAEGKSFATAEEWGKLTPEQKKDRWCFNYIDLSSLYAFKQAKAAKEIIKKSNERLEKVLKNRGITPPVAGNRAPAPAATPPAQPQPPKAAPASPAGVAAPRMATTQNRSPGEEKPTRLKILGR